VGQNFLPVPAEFGIVVDKGPGLGPQEGEQVGR
jgi:hypothetical protein